MIKIERQRIHIVIKGFQPLGDSARKPKGSYNMGGGCWEIGRPPCRVTRQILISGIGYRRRTSVIAKTENPNLQDIGQSLNVDSTVQRVT